jgi:hypothetical protein
MMQVSSARADLDHHLSCCFGRSSVRDNARVPLPADNYDPTPGPWEFHAFRNGLNNVVFDRLGHHLCSYLRHGDGPLMAAAPAMRDILVDLLTGAEVDSLGARVANLGRDPRGSAGGAGRR